MVDGNYTRLSSGRGRGYACRNCGKQFKPKHSRYTTFCSRECSFAQLAKNRLARAAAKAAVTYSCECRVCGKAWQDGQRSKVLCSKECVRRDAAAQAVARERRLHSARARVTCCDECGGLFCPLYGASSSSLCAPCRDVRRLAYRRAARLMRKALQRAATVERVDPIRVFERDGWQCRLCGTPTPKAKRGTYEADAPELDHVIPLAKGGAHSYANTQCACRRCNGAKSDSVGWTTENVT